MKTKNIVRILLMMGLGLPSSVMANAADPTGGGATNSTIEAMSTNANAQYNAERASQLNGCENIQRQQPYYCSQNPQMRAAQQATGLSNLVRNDNGGGESIRQGQSQANSSRMSLAQIRAACEEATSRCEQQCVDEANQHIEAGNRYNSSTPPQTQQAQDEYNKANEDNERMNQCRQEHATTQQAVAGLDAQLGDILAGLAALAQALGLGEGGVDTASLDEDEEEDKCEGEFAHLLIECEGQSDPSGTRAGLAGAGLTGNTTGQGITLNGTGSEESTGDTSGNGSGSGNPFASSGFGGSMGGLGSFGGGVGSSGSSGSGSGEDGPNTDIHKGFMGSSSGGGGFSGGGGGSAAAPRPSFSQFSNGGNGSSDKAALQRKLNKYADVSGSRAPASVGGANGPFENIWGVVNKAYKKNSSSMYHQR